MRAGIVVIVAGLAATAACRTRSALSEAREAWLTKVEGFARKPATMPRLADPARAGEFEALVSDPAWLAIDGPTFAREGLGLLRFFGAAKALTVALVIEGAHDESVLLGLYLHDVSQAFVRAGLALVKDRPAEDPTRAARLHGVDKVRTGAAIALAGVLFELPRASPAMVARAVDRLDDDATYADHDAESLQLVLATIDESVLPVAPETLRPALEAVRAVVGRHQRALAAAAPPDRIYEGLLSWGPLERRPTISRGGGFALDVGPGALVFSTTESGAAGTVTVEHLEWQSGEALVEVACRDDIDEATLAARLGSASVVERPGPAPGHWYTTSIGKQRGGGRVTTIGAHACLAGIQAPPGQLSEQQIDAVLSSLRPASAP